MQLLAGARERAGLRDGPQNLELTKVHACHPRVPAGAACRSSLSGRPVVKLIAQGPLRDGRSFRAPPRDNMRALAAMRIALAQLNPTERRHRRETRRRSSTRSTDAKARGAELLVAPEMVIPGYCIGDLVEDADFLAANERAVQRDGRRRPRHHRRRRLHRLRPHGPNDSGTHPPSTTPPQSSRDGADPPARPQVAAAQLPLLRRQAVLHACATRDPVDVVVGRQLASASASRSARTCGTRTTPSSRCPSSRHTARRCSSTSTRRRSTPGKRHERDALIRTARRAAAASRSSTSTPSARPTTARTSSRSTARASSTTPIGPIARDWPAVRRGAAGRRCADRSGARAVLRSHCRRSIANARSYDASLMALRDYMRKTGFTARRSPMSGGIDSALALAIAVDALGADRVSAFNMPSQFNSETTRVDCRAVAHALWASTYGVIPIQEIDERVSSEHSREHAHPIARGFTRENLQARIRGHPDDGGVERHRRAPHFLRQRNRDRARLRDALRRHVRRDLAHRRPLEDGRLPARSPRQCAARVGRKSPRRRSTSCRRRSSRPTSSTRSTTPSSRRSSARWSNSRRSPAELARCSSTARRSIRDRFLPTPRPDRLRQTHGGDVQGRPRRHRPPSPPVGLQAPPGPADRHRLGAGVRLRSAGDDHQWVGREGMTNDEWGMGNGE